MPYKDPNKASQAARESMRALRASRKLAKLKGDEPRGAERAREHGEHQAAPCDATDSPDLTVESLTRTAWSKELVHVGLLFVNAVKRVIVKSPRDAVALAQAGIELVNANWSAVDVEGGPHAGSVADLDYRLLQDDPEFRDLAEKMLVRKLELQMAWEEEQKSARPALQW